MRRIDCIENQVQRLVVRGPVHGRLDSLDPRDPSATTYVGKADRHVSARRRREKRIDVHIDPAIIFDLTLRQREDVSQVSPAFCAAPYRASNADSSLQEAPLT